MEGAAPHPHALELSALEAEKQPMAAAEGEGGGPDPAPPGGEKNGLVKLPQDEESGGGGGVSGGSKFTGLGKEELLRAAGAPPWAKARTILLLLFWLGWLGMLGAAVAIVVRAPRCRPLPPRAWWELGGLYRAPPRAFGGNLTGVAARLEHVAGLQMQGLVLGPLHPESGGSPQNLDLRRLDPQLGSLEDFAQLLQAARKKGLQVIVDLTPNAGGERAWFGPEIAKDPQFHEKVKEALGVWLDRGVGGFFLDGIEELETSVVAEWRNLTEEKNLDSDTPRVLVGGTRLRDPAELEALLGAAGVGLVLGPFLEAPGLNAAPPNVTHRLLEFLRPQTPLAWAAGSPWEHAATRSPPHAPQLLLLRWALPGTPALSYGDEVGLREPPGAPQPPPMPWDVIDSIREGDNSTEARLLELCRSLGALRARELSLAVGEAEAVDAGPVAAAFLRSWDQSERFLVVLNPGEQPLPHVALQDPSLPPQATLRLSTHRPLPEDPQVTLAALDLLPYEGLLLSFPYAP